MGHLDSFADITDFKTHDKIAFGRKHNIYFNVRFLNFGAQAQVFAFIKNNTGVNLNEINLFLKENRRRYKVSSAQSDGRTVSLVINSSTRVRPEAAARFIDDFAHFLIEKGYRSTCAFCEQTESLGHTAQNDLILESCESCHEKFSGLVDDMRQERETTGSYAKGTLGAVLGGIIGIIPWIIFHLLGFVAALSGLIMAYLCYYGYKLLKGKRGKGMLVIIVVVLIVFTYLAVLVNTGISVYQELAMPGYDIDFGALVSLILASPFSPEFFDTGQIWAAIGMGWLFAGIGSFFFLRKIQKESSGKDLNIKRINTDL